MHHHGDPLVSLYIFGAVLLAASALRLWRVSTLRSAGARLGFMPVGSSSVETREIDGPGGFMKVFYANHPGRGLNTRGVSALSVLRGAGSGEWLVEFFVKGSGEWMLPRTAAVFRVPGEDLPIVLLRARTVGDAGLRLPYGEVPATPDGTIFYASDPAHRLVPRLMSLWMSRAAEGWTIEAGYEWLILYRARGMVGGDGLQRFIEEARAMAAGLR